MQDVTRGRRRHSFVTVTARAFAGASLALASVAAASPVAQDVARGRALTEELGCARCHGEFKTPGLAEALAPVGPVLDGIGQRVSAEYLRRFLAAPDDVQPGTRMPAMLAHLAPAERDAAALALTHFLASSEEAGTERAPLEAADVALGRELFHTVGCVACHGPREAPVTPAPDEEEADDEADGEFEEEEEEPEEEPEEERATEAPAPVVAEPPQDLVSLTHVPAKYRADALADFLFRPLHFRPSGRMPDMLLSSAEARAIAGYLLAESEPAPEPGALALDSAQIDRGRALFGALGCAACHARAGTSAPEPQSSRALAPDRGCLTSAQPGVARPSFTLPDRDRAALHALLAATPEQRAAAPGDTFTVEHTLEAFRCVACHSHGELGGVHPALNPYFRTTQPDLGDEARIPPPLALVGAKLQGDWLREVLFDAGRVRSYMRTRMPQFGEANLAHLPGALERIDAGALPAFAVPVPEGELLNEWKRAGRELLGTTGLGCVTCHDFNGTPSPGFRGLDLITTPERLQPGWYARFLTAPQSLRRGIVMPESWPGGVAVHQGILGGDTDAQLRAIWTYLTQGRTADDPEGIRPKPTSLDVEGEARVYRGRSRVAGFRGFAVGSARGLHYAFDAERGALSALWLGDFIRVSWDGQGAGDFHPRGDAVELQRALGVAALPSGDAPWPLPLPPPTSDPKVNPSPLYPRDHGYRFLGYSTDAASIPTFRYTSGDVLVEDRSLVLEREGRPILRRTLTFTSGEPTTRYVRVLTGTIAERSPTEFAGERMLVTVPAGTRARLRTGSTDELILEVPLGAGLSTTTIDHELLR